MYLTGIIAFLVLLAGIPLLKFSYHAPTCTDGVQNQGETAADKGGPCPVLDGRALSPASILWSRSFTVRDGLYSSVAYVQNDNAQAGVRLVSYRFGLYDGKNVLIAERAGQMFIMPASITPVYEFNIRSSGMGTVEKRSGRRISYQQGSFRRGFLSAHNGDCGKQIGRASFRPVVCGGHL